MKNGYYDLGNHCLGITTSSVEAQSWFNRGLIWCYGFNHEEAQTCFRRAPKHDPGCAMAYWGLAYAGGPNYNKPWEAFDPTELKKSVAEGHDAINKARVHSGSATPLEQALIVALAARCPAIAPDSLAPLNDAYAQAMAKVHR